MEERLFQYNKQGEKKRRGNSFHRLESTHRSRGGRGEEFPQISSSILFYDIKFAPTSQPRIEANPFFQGRGATLPLIDRYNSIRLFEGRKSRETWDKLKGGGSADRRWYARKQFGGPQDRGGR